MSYSHKQSAATMDVDDLRPEDFAASDGRSLASLLNLEAQEKAYAWLIGRQVDGFVSSMMFGQFTMDPFPPLKGWVYMGQNIRSTISYTPADYQGSVSSIVILPMYPNIQLIINSHIT